MHKMALFLILTSCLACQILPPAPARTQYGAYPKVKPPGFYGVRSDTHARIYKPFTDSSMNGAQCLDAHDYKAMQAWIDSVKEIAEQRCR